MAIKQRVIKASIAGGYNLKHEGIATYYVWYDSGAPSRSEVSGDSLNYTKKSAGGYTNKGILYSNMNITGCNGGTTSWCWFQIYFDQTSSYDIGCEALTSGINNASINGTTINFDPDDDPDDAFDVLFIEPDTIYLQFCREDGSTKTNGLNLKDDSEIILYLGYNVDDPDPPPVPTNFKISSSSVRPEGSATLSWSGSADHFEIYRKLNSGSWSTDPVYTPEGTTQSVKASSSSGDTYYYRIRAKSGGLFSNYSSTTPSLKAELGQAGKPSVTINDKTTLYVAQPGSSTYTLKWSAPSAGTNNSIINYKIEQSVDNISFSQYGELLSSGTTSKAVPANSTNGASYYYRVLPVNKYGTCTSYSDSVQIKTIGKPTVAKITTAPSNANISQNFNVQWGNISSGTGYTISYKLYYVINDTATQIYTGTNTSATVNISSIANNSQFTLKLETIATATDGGTISDSTTYATTYTKGAAVSFNNKTLIIKNDAGTAAAPRAYNTVDLTWNKATTTDTASGTIKYKIRYKTSSMGEWDDLKKADGNKVENLTVTNYTVSNFSNVVNEGEEARFKILAYQTSTQTPAETDTVIITRMEKPRVTGGAISGTITSTSIPYWFSYEYNIPSEDINCIVELGYNGTYGGVSQTHILSQSTGTIQGEDTKLTFSLVSGNTSSSAVIKALYTKVITNHYVKPDGTLRITLSSISVPACSTTYLIPFKYNFKMPITSGTFTAGYNQNKNFYNPGDTINLRCTAPNWKDAAGGTTGAKSITYTYKGNNKEGQSISAGTTKTDIAPAASTDFSLVYTLYTTITYADDFDTVEVDSNSINIARWNNTDIAVLSSVIKTNSSISGFLVLPELLCASGQYANLSKVVYTIYSQQTKQPVSTELTNVTLTRTEAQAMRERKFDFTDESTGDLSYYATIIFTNTSGGEISKTTATYLIRSAGVPIAIRKGRIGINVGSATFIEETDVSKNSALYIASNNDTASILELSAGSNSINPYFINFLKGNEDYGKIFFNESDSLLHCDKWYYPVTKVNEKTGDITLTASDVKARPETWMPTAEEVATAGTGISISGKTISWSPTAGTGIDISGKTINNTGIINVETGVTSGTIKITKNGETTEVKVAGLGTMAYANTGSYLAKNNGAFTGTMTGPTITLSGAMSANVINGNAIIYTSDGSIPTGTAKGQIWLKKKGT